MAAIESLVPQRYPFLFIDAIIAADRNEIIGIKQYDKSFLYAQGYFPAMKTIPGVILVESLVQCGGAGIAQLGLVSKQLWCLASLDNVRFFDIVEPGATVKMVVKNLKVSAKVLKQAGTALVNDQPVLQAAWMCLAFK